MNNEEQIMATLNVMAKGIEVLVTKVEALTQGQADMQTDIAGMRDDQAESNLRLDKIEARIEDIHNNLAVMETDNKQAHGALFDKWDAFEKKADTVLEQEQLTENRLDNHDIRIKRLEKRVLAG